MQQDFSFKNFTIRQDRCAMKVGTDGVLLGAWAQVAGKRVLDIGTGTGLIALMVAQRYPDAEVTAIDIDRDAAGQAAENVAASPFSERISVRQCALQALEGMEAYDAIISNPPFFNGSLTCPDTQRTTARHTSSLSYAQLMSCSYRLLSTQGELHVIIPADCYQTLEPAYIISGFFLHRICRVHTTPDAPPRRLLLSFVKTPPNGIEETALVIGSDEHKNMVSI